MIHELFTMSRDDLDKEFKDKRLQIVHEALWLVPEQQSEHSCKKGSDVIITFFNDFLVMYCERLQDTTDEMKREMLDIFNKQIRELPPHLHSRVAEHTDFIELTVYRKEYLDWLES